MEIQIVKVFQGLSSNFADAIFWLITKMGEETFFLCLLAVVYISYSDKFALKLSFYYIISVGLNNFIKLICKRPRPYVVSAEIQDRLHANGYSFPSGHTQGYFVSATTTAIEVGNKVKTKSIKVSLISVFASLGVLVMLSRMYWGQHYLTDVVVGMMFGVGVPFFLDYIIRIIPIKIKQFFSVDRLYNILFCVSLVLILANMCIDIFIGESIDLVYKFSAIFLAMSIGYFVNKRKIKYIHNQGFKIGLLKSLITIVCIALIYFVFSLIFTIESYFCLIVYLFLGLFCTIILPIIFKLLFKKGYNDEKSNN